MGRRERKCQPDHHRLGSKLAVEQGLCTGRPRRERVEPGLRGHERALVAAWSSVGLGNWPIYQGGGLSCVDS